MDQRTSRNAKVLERGQVDDLKAGTKGTQGPGSLFRSFRSPFGALSLWPRSSKEVKKSSRQRKCPRPEKKLVHEKHQRDELKDAHGDTQKIENEPLMAI
jgi:hypothetical protein